MDHAYNCNICLNVDIKMRLWTGRKKDYDIPSADYSIERIRVTLLAYASPLVQIIALSRDDMMFCDRECVLFTMMQRATINARRNANGDRPFVTCRAIELRCRKLKKTLTLIDRRDTRRDIYVRAGDDGSFSQLSNGTSAKRKRRSRAWQTESEL